MSTFQIFPNFGRVGVIENQIFPKFKIVHIILGGGGSRKLWTFSTIWDIFFLECSLYEKWFNESENCTQKTFLIMKNDLMKVKIYLDKGDWSSILPLPKLVSDLLKKCRIDDIIGQVCPLGL